jgi:hypothetical protein
MKPKNIISYLRGHEIYWAVGDGMWRYLDDNSTAVTYAADGNRTAYERPCIRCGKMPTKEGYDACTGHIEGVKAACCGHGVEQGYVDDREETENV